MEIETTVLILVNLVLIESLSALAPSWALGTFISRLTKVNIDKPTLFTFVSFQLLKILLFLFFYYLSPIWRCMIVFSILFSMVGFVPFKTKVNKSIQYVLLLLMVVSILTMDQPFIGYYDSIAYPFNFTTNLYLIGVSYTIGIIVFWYVLSWAAKRNGKSKLVNWGGYFMLVLILVDSIFSDFLFPIVWDPFTYEDKEIVYSVREYLYYFLLATAVFLLLKYFIDRRKVKSTGKV